MMHDRLKVTMRVRRVQYGYVELESGEEVNGNLFSVGLMGLPQHIVQTLPEGQIVEFGMDWRTPEKSLDREAEDG